MIPAAAVALGAFLLFSIQPMAAKLLLPRFGGAPAVWTACLLFFQTLLLAAYLWAHYARPRWHAFLIALSVAALLADVRPAPTRLSADPTLDVIIRLAALIGAPYFILATTSPLLQRWSPLADPYRLYALSNLASIAALLAYPVLIEPRIPLGAQMRIWTGLFLGYAALAALATLASRRPGGPIRHGLRPSAASLAGWMALAAAGSALLMAATNQMCQEIAAVPFLWVLPLALYLLSFILCFDRPHWYDRRAYALLASLGIPAACALWTAGGAFALWIHLATGAVTLFVCLMLVHGELARTRPPAASLTWFYIAIAAGGALGGAFVALAAPSLFRTYAEYPLALASCALLALLQRWREGEFRGPHALTPLARATAVGLAVCSVIPFVLFDQSGVQVVDQRRGFHGVLRVTDRNDQEGHRRLLAHGATTHGAQFLDQSRRRTPGTYYGWASGVGRAIEEHPRRAAGTLRVGVIGLGAGTLARYARPGDHFRFYEINEQVVALARRHFTYLSDAAATPEIVLGDARLSLASEPNQAFDVLVLDAFSSDAIPTHLLTTEAGDLYRRHLREDGRLLAHISNRSLDLEPVVHALARGMGRRAHRIDSPADPSQGVYSATWMELVEGDPAPGVREIAWTDDFSGLWSVLR